MIRHIVMTKFKQGTDDATITDIEKSLRALPGKIPEIKEFECGRDVLHTERSFDFALISAFEDLDALQRYQVNPDHQAAAAKIRAVAEVMKAVDYEF